jgi:hypothetical protein
VRGGVEGSCWFKLLGFGGDEKEKQNWNKQCHERGAGQMEGGFAV